MYNFLKNVFKNINITIWIIKKKENNSIRRENKKIIRVSFLEWRTPFGTPLLNNYCVSAWCLVSLDRVSWGQLENRIFRCCFYKKGFKKGFVTLLIRKIISEDVLKIEAKSALSKKNNTISYRIRGKNWKSLRKSWSKFNLMNNSRIVLSRIYQPVLINYCLLNSLAKLIGKVAFLIEVTNAISKRNWYEIMKCILFFSIS